ncbi:MAG: hypothetical protein CSA31_00740 [Desulfobulbus propionicus]|nr:MAG: hypothetical protein CSA31_00740 [Desulfobulbus propionicus]
MFTPILQRVPNAWMNVAVAFVQGMILSKKAGVILILSSMTAMCIPALPESSARMGEQNVSHRPGAGL